MQPDGTITLRLRAEGPAGAIGEGLFVYRHGLRPGRRGQSSPFRMTTTVGSDTFLSPWSEVIAGVTYLLMIAGSAS